MRTRGTLLLLILGLVLTACGGDTSEPKDSALDLRAGTCIAKDVEDEGDAAPDLSSVMDCTAPHVYEILDVSDLPDEALTGTSDKEKLANRAELARVDAESSARLDAYYAVAGPTCQQATTKAAGYNDISMNGVSAVDAELYPMFGGRVSLAWVNLTPESLWLDGKRQMICSVRYVEAAADPLTDPQAEPVTSPRDVPLISMASSRSFPVELRACTNFDRKTRITEPVGCDQQHGSEGMFEFGAVAVFGEKLISGIDPEHPTDAQMAPLDRACTEALADVMADGFDKSQIVGKAFTLQWDDEYKSAACHLVARDFKKFDLGPGAIVWTDAKAVVLVGAK